MNMESFTSASQSPSGSNSVASRPILRGLDSAHLRLFDARGLTPSKVDDRYVERTIDASSPHSVDNSKRWDSFCVFCKSNGASRSVYLSHSMKDNRGSVVCPVLRKFNCPHCNNGGGDRAHTANYCPKKRADYLNAFLKGDSNKVRR